MALNGKFVSIKRILDSLVRRYPSFSSELDIGDVAEDIADAIDLIGVPLSYTIKCTNDEDVPKVNVTNYRGKLPCDLLFIKGIRDFDSKITYRKSTNTFHKTMEAGYDDEIYFDYTYKVDGGYIFTNIEECDLEIVYGAFMVDDDGYPMIPDDTRYVKAVTSYIAERVAYKLYMENKLDERKYSKIEQDWLFYVNSAASSARMPDYDDAEALKNQILRLITDTRASGSGFKNLGVEEEYRG